MEIAAKLDWVEIKPVTISGTVSASVAKIKKNDPWDGVLAASVEWFGVMFWG